MFKKIAPIVLAVILAAALPITTFAQQETVLFNGWSELRNYIKLQLFNGNTEESVVSDNDVFLEGQTTVIRNSQPIMDRNDAPYFTRAVLSVDTNHLKEVFYVSQAYVGKKYTMNVSMHCSSGTDLVLGNVKLEGAEFALFTSTAAYPNQTMKYCTVKNLLIKSTTKTDFVVSMDVEVNVTSPFSICGFWINFKGIFDYDLVNPGQALPSAFLCEYRLTPLIFSNDLTSEEFNAAMEEQTNKITDNQDKNADKIVGAINDAQDREKEEANSSGNSSVDSVTSAIPGDSAGFISAIKTLAGSMSYDGTDAIWTVPSMKVPALEGGIMDEMKLTDDMDINFATYVSWIPEKVLEVVRILCTVALIYFCVRELYGLVQEVMVNRRSAD